MLLFTLSGEENQRRWLERAVAAATDAEVALGRPFRLELGERVTLEATGVRISGMSAGPVSEFRAERVQLDFPLAPLLLHRRLELGFRQEGGVIRLRTGGGSGGGPAPVRVVPGRVVLKDVTLFVPRAGKSPVPLRIAGLSLGRSGGSWGLELRGRYGTLPLQLKTTLAQQPEPGSGRRAMELTGRLGRLRVTGKGWQGGEKPSLLLHLSLKAPDLRFLPGPPFDSLPPAGPLKASLDLVADGGYRAEKLHLELGGGKAVRLVARGRVEDLVDGKGLMMEIEASSRDLPALARLMGLQPRPVVTTGSLAGRLQGDYRTLDLRNLRVHLEGPELDLRASGEATRLQRLQDLGLHLKGKVVVEGRGLDFVANLEGEKKQRRPLELLLSGDGIRLRGKGSFGTRKEKPVVELGLRGEAADLKRLGPWLGLELKPVKPVKLEGRISWRGSTLELELKKLQVGSSDLAGILRMESGRGAPFHLDGDLTSHTWNLGEQLVGGPSVKPRLLQGEEAEKALPQKGEGAPYFSRHPWKLGWLSRVEGRVGLHVGVLRNRHYRLEGLSSEVRLSGRELRMDRIEGRLGGKPIHGSFRLDGAAGPPEMALKIDVREADLASGVPGFGLPPDSGQASLQLDLRGRGRSQAELAATLEGEGRLLLRHTPFGFTLPQALERSLLEYLNPAARGKPAGRKLECGAVQVVLHKGVARTPRGLVLDFPRVTWIGDGVVDLGKETLYITLKPHTKRAFGLSLGGLADLVAVAGPLSSPYIVVNPRGALLTSLSYTAAVYTGGISLLVEGLLEELRRDRDPCARVWQGPVSKAGGSPARKAAPPSASVLDELEAQ